MELLVAQGSCVQGIDAEGETALMRAALNGHARAIHVRCKAVCFFFSAQELHVLMIINLFCWPQFLLDVGADINARSSLGSTAYVNSAL